MRQYKKPNDGKKLTYEIVREALHRDDGGGERLVQM